MKKEKECNFYAVDKALNELEALNNMLLLMEGGLVEFSDGHILTSAFFNLYLQYLQYNIVLKKLRALTDC